MPDIQRTAEIVYAATTSLRQANQGTALFSLCSFSFDTKMFHLLLKTAFSSLYVNGFPASYLLKDSVLCQVFKLIMYSL